MSDRPGRGEHADELPSHADRVDELPGEGDSLRPRSEGWKDPRDFLSPEDRAQSYSRKHETLSEERLAKLEAENIERYGVPYGWDDDHDYESANELDSSGETHGPRLAGSSNDRTEDHTDQARPDELALHVEPASVGRIRAEHGDSLVETADPSGDELVSLDPDKLSRRERVAREAFRKTEDIIDVGNKAGDRLQQLLGPKPTGTEVRVVGPDRYVSETHRDVPDAGSAVTAIMVTAALGYHAIRAGVRHRRGKGPEDAGDG